MYLIKVYTVLWDNELVQTITKKRSIGDIARHFCVFITSLIQTPLSLRPGFEKVLVKGLKINDFFFNYQDACIVISNFFA